jgi:putative DNA primase/helicase
MNLLDEMRKGGIECNESPIVDGEIHRFREGDDKRGRENGWYVFHQKRDKVYGAYGSWKLGITGIVGGKQAREVLRTVMATRKEEDTGKHNRAAMNALQEWTTATELTRIDQSAYLCRKHALPFGLRTAFNKVLVPMYDAHGDLAGIQSIDNDGEKRFTPGMKKRGTWFLIHGIGSTVVLCEGYATGASIHMATRLPVLVAFDCGNLLPAAQSYASGPNGKLKWIVAADNDEKTVGNPGLTKAFEAAHFLDGRLAAPLGAKGRLQRPAP